MTSVFRKETFTGLLVNWESWSPKIYKLSIIKGLHERARRLASTNVLFNIELKFIFKIMCRNGYPKKLLKEMEINTRKLRQNFGMGPLAHNDTEAKTIYIKLPYCGPVSEAMAKRLRQYMKRVNKDLNICTSFQQKKISSMFQFKDRCSNYNRNNVVYRIDCPSCDEFYIGETFRRVGDRFKEHNKESFGGRPGTFYEHARLKGCNLPDFNNNCSFLLNENRTLLRKIKESLLIRNKKSSLNGNQGSYDLELFYT